MRAELQSWRRLGGTIVALCALLATGCGQYCHRQSFNLEEAQTHLEQAAVFEYPPTAAFGVAASSVCAYQRILKSKRAEPIFLELLEEARDAGRVYAMAGLTQVAPERVEAARVSIHSRLDRFVPIRSGCEVGRSSVAALLRRDGLAEELSNAYKARNW